jgi:ribosomal protein S18 acetylase RimI-like enzyme
MEEIQIRRATPEDLEAVLDLWQEMMDYHASLDRRFQQVADSRDHFRMTLREWMADDTQRVLVAVDDGEIVGYTIGRIAENPPMFQVRFLGHVSDICVAREQRRQGIGRKLFSALLNWFRRQGLPVVQLSVAAANPVSQAFWREMGFQDYTHRMWLEI